MNSLVSFVSAHVGVFSLVGIALVVTMREKLPSPLNKVELFNWLYEWVHDAAKTFVSLRGPKA